MTLSTSSDISEIIANWKQFRSGHKPLSEVREKIISAQENGTRFFAEDSAPELGPEMMNDEALRHELTAAEMAFEKRALAATVETVPNFDPNPAPNVKAYEWLADRAGTNPYAHHISVKDNIEIRPHNGIPLEATHEVPVLSDQQKLEAAMSKSEVVSALKELRSSAGVYFKDGQKGFEHIVEQLTPSNGASYDDVVDGAGAENKFRKGVFRRPDKEARDEAREDLRLKTVIFHSKKADGLDRVDQEDRAFRGSLIGVPLNLEREMSVAQTQAHPDKYTKSTAVDALSNIRERYDQHMLKQGAGLREEPAKQLIEASQTLPSLVERPVRVSHDLSSFFKEEGPFSKVANALTGIINSEDAHEILHELEWIASPSTASVLRSAAESNSTLSEQAGVLETLIRDRLPDVRHAIESTEYYDYSDVAVKSQDVVDKLTSDHTNKALARLSAVVSSSVLKENLNSVVRHKTDASQDHRPQMRAMP